MAVKKLSASSIRTNTWYRSMMTGNTAAPTSISLRYVIVGGGGGGGTPGATYCGGGGAGGFLAATSSFSAQNLQITVGAGGAIASTGSNTVLGTLTAFGGGLGASNVGQAGGAGGSGGGGNRVSQPGGSRVVGQGNVGGFGSSSASSGDSGAGGGGGAGGPGYHLDGNQNTNEPAAGGAGLSTDITGTLTWFAEGGSGSGYYNRGTYNQNLGGNIYGHINGNTNTGSGGGGGRQGAAGGAGGSGIVIIRYASSLSITGGSGLTFTTSTVGSDKVTTFTAGTGTISFS